jgi:hypothetical protein
MMTAVWDIASYSLVEVDGRFRGTYCLHHQGALIMESVSTYETSVSVYETIGAISQKAVIFILSGVRT